jgi:hypothetical protein
MLDSNKTNNIPVTKYLIENDISQLKFLKRTKQLNDNYPFDDNLSTLEKIKQIVDVYIELYHNIQTVTLEQKRTRLTKILNNFFNRSVKYKNNTGLFKLEYNKLNKLKLNKFIYEHESIIEKYVYYAEYQQIKITIQQLETNKSVFSNDINKLTKLQQNITQLNTTNISTTFNVSNKKLTSVEKQQYTNQITNIDNMIQPLTIKIDKLNKRLSHLLYVLNKSNKNNNNIVQIRNQLITPIVANNTRQSSNSANKIQLSNEMLMLNTKYTITTYKNNIVALLQRVKTKMINNTDSKHVNIRGTIFGKSVKQILQNNNPDDFEQYIKTLVFKEIKTTKGETNNSKNELILNQNKYNDLKKFKNGVQLMTKLCGQYDLDCESIKKLKRNSNQLNETVIIKIKNTPVVNNTKNATSPINNTTSQTKTPTNNQQSSDKSGIQPDDILRVNVNDVYTLCDLCDLYGVKCNYFKQLKEQLEELIINKSILTGNQEKQEELKEITELLKTLKPNYIDSLILPHLDKEQLQLLNKDIAIGKISIIDDETSNYYIYYGQLNAFKKIRQQMKNNGNLTRSIEIESFSFKKKDKSVNNSGETKPAREIIREIISINETTEINRLLYEIKMSEIDNHKLSLYSLLKKYSISLVIKRHSLKNNKNVYNKELKKFHGEIKKYEVKREEIRQLKIDIRDIISEIKQLKKTQKKIKSNIKNTGSITGTYTSKQANTNGSELEATEQKLKDTTEKLKDTTEKLKTDGYDIDKIIALRLYNLKLKNTIVKSVSGKIISAAVTAK